MATIPADPSKNDLQVKSVPDWRELAARVSEETDPNKVLEHTNELIRALDADSRKLLDCVTVEDKASEPDAA